MPKTITTKEIETGSDTHDMKKIKKQPELGLKSDSGQLQLTEIDYLGSGAYSCRLFIESSGFSCDRLFDFDNDEYFVSKTRDVLTTHSGEADLMGLQADSYVRIKAYDDNHILVSGFIVEETNVTQSLEFAFPVSKTSAKKFLSAFEKMVRANI